MLAHDHILMRRNDKNPAVGIFSLRMRALVVANETVMKMTSCGQ